MRAEAARDGIHDMNLSANTRERLLRYGVYAAAQVGRAWRVAGAGWHAVPPHLLFAPERFQNAHELLHSELRRHPHRTHICARRHTPVLKAQRERLEGLQESRVEEYGTYRCEGAEYG